MNIDIWISGTLNQLFLRGYNAQIKLQKNKVPRGKIPFFATGPF